MKLEVIAKDLIDIKQINQSNADRIEFCHNLEVGGLTPSYEEIIQAGDLSKIPVNVMLRPTERDFYYTDQEFEQMVKDAEFIASTNVSGIVVGIITPQGEINIERMKKIIQIAKDNNKTITFHKAFEELKNPMKSLDILFDLGVDTILTSGTKNINSKESLDLLQKLKNDNKVIILAGGGVDQKNIDNIKNNVNEVHVGTAAREEKNWIAPISVVKINELKNKISK